MTRLSKSEICVESSNECRFLAGKCGFYCIPLKYLMNLKSCIVDQHTAEFDTCCWLNFISYIVYLDGFRPEYMLNIHTVLCICRRVLIYNPTIRCHPEDKEFSIVSGSLKVLPPSCRLRDFFLAAELLIRDLDVCKTLQIKGKWTEK